MYGYIPNMGDIVSSSSVFGNEENHVLIAKELKGETILLFFLPESKVKDNLFSETSRLKSKCNTPVEIISNSPLPVFQKMVEKTYFVTQCMYTEIITK